MLFENMTYTEVIETLQEGRMLSNRMVKYHAQRALSTNDPAMFFDYLKRYPQILATAKRNIEVINHQQAVNPFKPYPTPAEARRYLSGPINLGYVNSHDDMFGIHPDIFCMIMIILGRVGSGKSQFILNLSVQILKAIHSFNMLFFDLKGKEYRNLLQHVDNLKIITREKLKINPLQVPEWMDPKSYAMLFSKIFIRENYLMATSESILFETLNLLYKKRGIYEGNKNWPTLRDLYNVICYRLNNEKSFRYRDVLLGIKNRLDPYIYGEGFVCHSGISDEVWRDENVVIEMGKGFTDNMYSFVISFITGLRYSYNIEQGIVGSILRSLIVVDEGRLLFRQRDKAMFGESYIAEVATRLRDPGIGLLIATQESSAINSSVKSISHTKICFPITDGEEVSFVRDSFGLSDDEANFLFRLPQFGQCIVRYGGYEEPFLLAVPYMNIKNYVSDEEVNRRMGDFYRELNEKIVEEKPSAPTTNSSNSPESMPPSAPVLLHFLGNNPFAKVSEMKRSGLKSPAEVNRALTWLEENGFVKVVSIQVSKKGRPSKYAPLTPKAYTQLKMKPPKGKGDFEHKLYQHLISEHLKKKGWQIQIEGRIGQSQKLIDVLARSEAGDSVAYEVTLHFDNLISNIQQDLDSGVSEVVIVAKDKAGMSKAKKIVNSDPSMAPYLEQINFSLISAFFP